MNQYNHIVKLNNNVTLEPALLAIGKPYKNDKPSKELLSKIVKVYKHESCAEHIVFNFDITGISRAVLQELARHRIGSFTVESTRFCLKKILKNYKEDVEREVNEYTQDEIYDKEFETVHKIISKYCSYNIEGKTENQKWGMVIALMSSLNNLLSLSEEGLSNDELKPFIPEALRTTLCWTVNLRALNNFLQLRTDPHAFHEMRMLALEVQKVAKETEAGFLVYDDNLKE